MFDNALPHLCIFISVLERPDSQNSFYRFIFNEASKLEDVSIIL